MRLLKRLERKRKTRTRRRMAASVAGGGALFTLAAIAFLASLSPTTFPLILVAIGLALLGFLCAVAPPVAEFFL